MKRLTSIFQSVVKWFEFGDLVPLLVTVSAVHYVDVLASKDQWYVAVAIGLLVDLGHYRWVRAAARYNGSFKWGGFTRWLFAILMTVVSLVYHERFYTDLWLSMPLPFLIASLAWLSKVDANVGKVRKKAEEVQQTEKIIPQPKPINPEPTSEPSNGKPEVSEAAVMLLRKYPELDRVTLGTDTGTVDKASRIIAEVPQITGTDLGKLLGVSGSRGRSLRRELGNE